MNFSAWLQLRAKSSNRQSSLFLTPNQLGRLTLTLCRKQPITPKKPFSQIRTSALLLVTALGYCVNTQSRTCRRWKKRFWLPAGLAEPEYSASSGTWTKRQLPLAISLWSIAAYLNHTWEYLMKKFVSLQKAMLSSLVYEAAALRGLSLEEIVVLCIEPDSEYADLIPWLTTEPITPGRIACCVADATVLAPILEVLPELQPSLARELPANNARLVALGKDAVYVCHLESLPPRQLLN